jgi:hypothetical protein
MGQWQSLALKEILRIAIGIALPIMPSKRE